MNSADPFNELCQLLFGKSCLALIDAPALSVCECIHCDVVSLLLEVCVDPGEVAVVERLWQVAIEVAQVHHGASEAHPVVIA